MENIRISVAAQAARSLEILTTAVPVRSKPGLSDADGQPLAGLVGGVIILVLINIVRAVRYRETQDAG